MFGMDELKRESLVALVYSGQDHFRVVGGVLRRFRHHSLLNLAQSQVHRLSFIQSESKHYWWVRRVERKFWGRESKLVWVLADSSEVKERMEVFEGHEEGAVLPRAPPAHLVLHILSPKGRLTAPVSPPLKYRLRVSQFHEFLFFPFPHIHFITT